jgi:hypothetical protein
MVRRPTPRCPLVAALGLLALAVAGCQQPGETRIVGPDGSRMSHVHCGTDQATCFRIAGELCPDGYEMKPVLSGSDGNFLVRCRASAVSTIACAPGGSVPVGALARPVPGTLASSSNSERWPPSNEAWPLMYPWPPPEPTAGVGQAPAPPAKNKDIDIGY